MIVFSISAVLLSRVLNVMICSRLINWGSQIKLDFKKQFFMCFSGVRGAMAFALAFQSMLDLDTGKVFLLCSLIYTNFTLLYSSFFTSLVFERCNVLESEEIVDDSLFSRFKSYIAYANDKYFMKAVFRDEESLLGSRKTSKVGWRRKKRLEIELENTEIPLSNAFANITLKIRNQFSFSLNT